MNHGKLGLLGKKKKKKSSQNRRDLDLELTFQYNYASHFIFWADHSNAIYRHNLEPTSWIYSARSLLLKNLVKICFSLCFCMTVLQFYSSNNQWISTALIFWVTYSSSGGECQNTWVIIVKVFKKTDDFVVNIFLRHILDWLAREFTIRCHECDQVIKRNTHTA